LPCGAMRGFGVNQVTFAMEGSIDQLCKKGKFDRFQIRYQNALDKGLCTTTGQVLTRGIGIKKTLLAVKKAFQSAQYAGIACGIKNTGIGNGIMDFSHVKIEIVSENDLVIHHGWTEMGQGIFTIAQQILHEETGIPCEMIRVKVETQYEAEAGMTTGSRGTSLLGNSIIAAAKKLKTDLKNYSLAELKGKIYYGEWKFEETTPAGEPGQQITHYSYSYATQVVIMDDQGKINKIVAAHDAGRIINPVLFKSQVIGAVHMGLGYAISENLPMKDGYLKSTKMRDLGILPVTRMPEVEVIGIEVADPEGPYGAKGVGEIGLVPTAAAVANAYSEYHGKRITKLPIIPEKNL
ncbi:MAG: molybdopterin-dependent oxidoreductase, partial [Spirochaetes bacterium]|nr:molybdopterin-dependent oxidoreductase [Spirochaetota bacterium]